MASMSVANSLVAEVVEHSLHCFLGVHSVRDGLRLSWHVLHRQNVHFLVLVPKVLRENVTKRFGRAQNWERRRWIVRECRSHVDNSTFLGFRHSFLQAWAQELRHEHQGETVHVDCLDQ